MAFYSGADGSLLINGTEAGKVRNWSLSVSGSTLETTSLKDTDRTVIPGVRSTTGNCSLFYYNPEVGSNSAADLLNQLIKQRSGADAGIAQQTEPITIQLRINDGTPHGRYVTGECVITSAAISMGVGEVLSADIAFEFNGAPTGVLL